jgi:DNA-binding FadR family transcriptional regulator
MKRENLIKALNSIPYEDFVFLARVKEKCGFSGRQPTEAITTLEALGLVEVERKGKFYLIRRKKQGSDNNDKARE